MNEKGGDNDLPAGAAELMDELADLSARRIMPLFRSSLAIEEKHGKGIYDPVTAADREAEQVMRRHVRERFPDHGLIGEEFGEENAGARYLWIFDPIDGTRAFIAGAPSWGTLIGLMEDGRPLLGMMNQPFTGERFYGGPEGSFFQKDGGERQRLAVRKQAKGLEQAILSTTSPQLFASSKDREAFERLAARVRMTRYGLDCYAYCLLAMGLIDIVAESGLAIYDIAPLIPIVEGAGGIVTCWDGSDPAQGGTILASATPALHKQAMTILNAG